MHHHVIADRHPLKQGLKLTVLLLLLLLLTDRRPTSTKTRIETPQLPAPSCSPGRIADRHPLKQGLKRCLKALRIRYLAIADRHPLKQGLKHSILRRQSCQVPNRRPTSTKTRIETS